MIIWNYHTVAFYCINMYIINIKLRRLSRLTHVPRGGCMLGCFSRVHLFVTLWTIIHQAPPSVRFPRQEYWSGLAFPLTGDFPDLGIKPMSLLHGQVDSLPLHYLGSPKKICVWNIPHSCLLLTLISFDSIFSVTWAKDNMLWV